MWLECEWRHARKRWAENLEILKKTSVRSWLWTSRVGSWLGPCRLTVEVEFRPWYWEVWISTFEAYGWVFCVLTSEDELRSKTPRDVPSIWVLLASYDYKKTFKNCFSLSSSCRRTELRSQEVNKRSYLNNGVACVFEYTCVFSYIYMYNCYWYGLWLYNTDIRKLTKEFQD